MISVNPRQTLARFWILAAAGLALSSHAAFAAPPAGDVQTQARALLTGAAGGAQAVPRTAILTSTSGQSRDLDVQEQARAVLLAAGPEGRDVARGAAARAVAIRTVDIRSIAARSRGAQESARRMILGVTE